MGGGGGLRPLASYHLGVCYIPLPRSGPLGLCRVKALIPNERMCYDLVHSLSDATEEEALTVPVDAMEGRRVVGIVGLRVTSCRRKG